MALQAATAITAVGVLAATAAPNLTDTISQNDVGARGCILEVNNGSGAGITVTIADPGYTPGGNQATGFPAVSIAAAAKKRILIPPTAVNPATATASVTYSAVTSVTFELYRIP